MNQGHGKNTRVEIVQDLATLRSLAESWNALAQRLETPLLRHEWFTACAEAFCPPSQLAIVLVHSQEEILAIAPLVIQKRFGLERVELLGTSVLLEPSAFLYEDESALAELVEAIVALGKPMLLRRLPAQSPERILFNKLFPRGVFWMCTRAARSPVIPIVTGWTEFEKKISSSRRSSFRRAQKRAEEFGRVQFEVISPGLDNLKPYLDEVFQVEAAGWKQRKGTAMQSNAALRRFFSAYSEAVASLGMLRLCFLRIEGRAIAVQLAVEYAKRFWLLKIGFDERWARCSPGILLMHETIRYAFEHKLEAFELLGGDEPWLHIWTDEVNAYETHVISPPSFTGFFAMGMECLVWLSGKVRAKIPRIVNDRA
jgi:CelD/BcsL family acetyltransferase involved in cellulose biosynthesis